MTRPALLAVSVIVALLSISIYYYSITKIGGGGHSTNIIEDRFVMPRDYATFHEMVAVGLERVKTPDCQLTNTSHNVFSIKETLDVVRSDTCYLTSEAKHTTWNEEAQSFEMRCKQPYQVAMYNLGPYQHDYEEYNQLWRFYPQEPDSPIAKLLSGDPDLVFDTVPISMANTDMVHTVCVDLKLLISYHDFFANVVRNESTVAERMEILKTRHAKKQENEGTETKNLNNLPVDIRVIVLDSTGRHFFYRHFPNTHSYLMELMSQMTDESHGAWNFTVQEMTNYHVVGYNSIPNMYSLMTGEQFNDYSDYDAMVEHAHQGTLPQFKKMLWDYIKEQGYITSIGEDVPDTETGKFYGFKDVPRSFDTYPSYNKVSEIVQNHHENFFSYDPNACPCVGNKFMGEMVFEWAELHALRYPDLPNLVVTVHDEAHDSVCNQCMALDLELKQHLQWYVESGRANHTAILLLADHGLHYGDGYSIDEEVAVLEHENPVMFWLLPNFLATETFKANSDKMVTLKDVHMTLRDIASFPNRDSADSVRIDALSLIYDQVPAFRTCKSLRIPAPYINACPDKEDYTE